MNNLLSLTNAADRVAVAETNFERLDPLLDGGSGTSPCPIISGSPEGVVAAPIGAMRLDGDTDTLYIKKRDDGEVTGWIAFG